MAYPTNHQIEEIFQLRDSWDTIPKYREYLADNLIGHVAGFDHELAGEYRGKDAWLQNVEMRVGKMLKKDHPINLEIVNVIGGGDTPWACIQMRSRTKTHHEKDFGHEFCYVVKFNSEGKIIKVTAYFDSHHTGSHLKEHAAAGPTVGQK
ncbi:hypothetical protein BDR22DRAFT_887759 [Usnea florida]